MDFICCNHLNMYIPPQIAGSKDMRAHPIQCARLQEFMQDAVVKGP